MKMRDASLYTHNKLYPKRKLQKISGMVVGGGFRRMKTVAAAASETLRRNVDGERDKDREKRGFREASSTGGDGRGWSENMRLGITSVLQFLNWGEIGEILEY